ncbi:MAG: hypothetical protein KF857_03755 [Fimbriimonadaceae bacterium]|nr:hypothetical protein [Fimbriimonadaceae bacterium]
MSSRLVGVVLGAVGCAVVLVAVPVAWMKSSAQSSESLVKKLMADHGLPVTTAGLYPPPTAPADENAAMLMDEMAKVSRPAGAVVVKAPPPGGDWDVGQLRRSVDSRHDLISLAERAAAMPYWQPVMHGEGPYLRMDQISPIRAGAKALAERARLRAAEGDLGGCVKDAQSILDLGDLLRDEPVMISGLVRVATHAIAYQVMAETSGKVRRDKAAMDELVKLAARPVVNDYRRMFLGEATMAYHMATHRFDAVDYSLDDSAGSAPATKLRFAKMELDRPYWGPVLVRAWVDYLDQARKHPSDIDANQEAFAKLGRLAQSKDDRLDALSLVFPVFDQAFVAFRREAAKRDLLEIGLRAVRDGGMPQVGLTRDPFSHQPYRVAKTDSGWRVYSVGPDHSDDQGIAQLDKSPASDTPRGDIVFAWDGARASLQGR